MKKARSYSVILALLCFIFLAVAGCSEGQDRAESDSKKLSFAFPWSPKSLDPHGSDSWEVMRSGAGETLIKLNEDLKPEPWLASSWERKDRKTWTFTLRENVSFHNGEKMSAESVKKSLLRSNEKDSKVKDLLKLETIRVIDDHKIEIVTKQPNEALISHLADPSTIIAEVSTLDEKEEYPSLTGAFQFEKFNKDESLIMKRNEEYWGQKARVTEIDIKFISDGNTRLMALQSGDVDGAVDISTDQISVLKNSDNINVLAAPSLRTHMMMFNMNSARVTNLSVRQAIDKVLPREEILTSIMKNEGTKGNGPFPDVLSFGKVKQSQESQSFDSLMKQGGYTKEDGVWTKGGEPLQLTMLTFPQRPELTVMAETIQSSLLKEGIKVKVRSVENIDDVLAEDNWDLSMYSMLTAHTGDPQYFLNLFYNSKSLANVSHYNSAEVDKLLTELNQTSGEKEREEIAIKIGNQINKDIPQSFIVYPNTVFGVNEKVKNFEPSPIEYYYITPNVDVSMS
ncbi:ABC transporter substrate-binding protein [Bacillus sp. JZ8]